MLESTQTPNLTFIVHEDYYELVLHAPTRFAVDEWVDKIGLIWELHDKTRKPICTLTVSGGKETVPLNYAFKRGIELSRNYRNLPKSRSAFLLEMNSLLRIMDGFLRLLPLQIQYKYLDPKDRQIAVDWLTEWFSQEAKN